MVTIFHFCRSRIIHLVDGPYDKLAKKYLHLPDLIGCSGPWESMENLYQRIQRTDSQATVTVWGDETFLSYSIKGS